MHLLVNLDYGTMRHATESLKTEKACNEHVEWNMPICGSASLDQNTGKLLYFLLYFIFTPPLEIYYDMLGS